MADKRISHVKGKGSLNHNNRNHFSKNVDPSRTQNNVCYVKESLTDAYQKCFGQTLADYNAKQKRADRKIDDYYTHLFGNAHKDVIANSTNKEKSFYEIVAQVGDKRSCPVGSADGELAAKVLDEYAKCFSERNPNFYVFNSVLHLDEKTPHLHIDYVPIANGCKNGLQTRNSQSVALQQMGFGKDKDSINKWRIQERKFLREICEKYGLEIAEEAKGRGKTYTPDEYKKMRDEAKEELKSDLEVLDEIKDEIKQEATAELQAEISEETTKLKKAKEQLAQENVQIEGKVALEQRVKKLIDGTQEKNLFGKTKTTITYEGTAEEVMTVLKAAQQSAKDRTNAKKFKAERDTAITDKNTAIAERNIAIKAKDEAVSKKNLAETTSKKSEVTAKAQISEANQKMEQATVLYNQQQNLNNLYETAITNLKHYMDKTEELTEQVTDLKEGVQNAYRSLGAMAKANGSLLYDPALKIENLTPEQERLLQATRNYAVTHSQNAGFEDIAQDVEKHYGLTKGIQNHIDDLTPKVNAKKRNYDHGLG